jgi:hypothetical protein
VPILRDILFRKFISFGLLVLILIIHGAKLFHHHTTSSSPQHKLHKGFPVVDNSSARHCSICDFQPGRDADVIAEDFIFRELQIAVDTYAYYATFYCLSVSSDLRLRGPPATV